MTELPDVNVLLGMLDPGHVHHIPAQQWFDEVQRTGWAACPLVENGYLRIISAPRYPYGPLSIPDAQARLLALKASFASTYTFWPDDVSLTDAGLFDVRQLTGHKQWTDLYLLGLCHKHGGTLATFDGGIPQLTRAVVGGSPALARVLA